MAYIFRYFFSLAFIFSFTAKASNTEECLACMTTIGQLYYSIAHKNENIVEHSSGKPVLTSVLETDETSEQLLEKISNVINIWGGGSNDPAAILLKENYDIIAYLLQERSAIAETLGQEKGLTLFNKEQIYTYLNSDITNQAAILSVHLSNAYGGILFDQQEDYIEKLRRCNHNLASLYITTYEKLKIYYLQYAALKMVLGESEQITLYTKNLYKTAKNYSLKLQDYLKTARNNHLLVAKRKVGDNNRVKNNYKATVKKFIDYDLSLSWKKSITTVEISEALEKISLSLIGKHLPQEKTVIISIPNSEFEKEDGKLPDLLTLKARSMLKPNDQAEPREEIREGVKEKAIEEEQERKREEEEKEKEKEEIATPPTPLTLQEEIEASASILTPEIKDSYVEAFTFIQDLEQPGSPIVQKVKVNKKSQAIQRKDQRKPKTKPSMAIEKSVKHTTKTKAKNKIALTFSSTMTPDAVKDFLEAINALSPQKIGALPRVVRENINLLRTSKNENIKKQYKRILHIVPHIGSISYKRGKGSHCMIDIPLQ